MYDGEAARCLRDLVFVGCIHFSVSYALIFKYINSVYENYFLIWKVYMKTIFLFGNCQVGAIMLKLNLDLNNYKIHTEPCHTTTINKIDFTNIINKSDIIITQNIKDGYRRLEYLNLNYILNNSKDKPIIIVPSCYFHFYYPDLKYINTEGGVLHEPIAYHYEYMIQNFKNDGSIENYIENYVNNSNLISKEELLSYANNSINELKNRTQKLKDRFVSPNVYTICIAEFIATNYKDKLLFYSMNHPTKYIINYITDEIIKILKIKNTINYDIDPLDNVRCTLYKCIQPLVNFDISKKELRLPPHTNIYQITKLYYETYNNLDSKIKLT